MNSSCTFSCSEVMGIFAWGTIPSYDACEETSYAYVS